MRWTPFVVAVVTQRRNELFQCEVCQSFKHDVQWLSPLVDELITIPVWVPTVTSICRIEDLQLLNIDNTWSSVAQWRAAITSIFIHGGETLSSVCRPCRGSLYL